MQYGISILLSGISLGGQYALIAIGYTMVYGILRLINFAHGDVFMAAGLIMVYLSASLPIGVALPLMILLTVLLGFVIERAAYKPLRSAPRMSVMISAIGVSYLLQNLATYITGGLPQMYPSLPGLSSQITIAGTSTKMVTVITPFLVVALVVVLTQLINHTKIGMAMRAASRDFETAQLMGIKINNIISFTFVIGSFLAAVGSALYFTNYPSIVPLSGSLPGLTAGNCSPARSWPSGCGTPRPPFSSTMGCAPTTLPTWTTAPPALWSLMTPVPFCASSPWPGNWTSAGPFSSIPRWRRSCPGCWGNRPQNKGPNGISRSVLNCFLVELLSVLAGGFALLATLDAGAVIILALADLSQHTGLGAAALKTLQSALQRLIFTHMDFRHSIFPSLRDTGLNPPYFKGHNDGFNIAIICNIPQVVKRTFYFSAIPFTPWA